MALERFRAFAKELMCCAGGMAVAVQECDQERRVRDYTKTAVQHCWSGRELHTPRFFPSHIEMAGEIQPCTYVPSQTRRVITIQSEATFNGHLQIVLAGCFYCDRREIYIGMEHPLYASIAASVHDGQASTVE